jgi:hypothetical protein
MRSLRGRVSAFCVLTLIIAVAVGLAAPTEVQSVKQTSKPTSSIKAPNIKSVATPVQRRAIASKFGELPLSFEVNVGQAARSVDFVSHAGGETVLLAATQATVVTGGQTPTSSTDPFLKKLSPAQLKRFEATKAYRTPRFRRPAKATKVSLAFEGADTKATAQPLNALPGAVSYFLGNDPSKWHSGVSTYARVKYHDVYPGIDLAYYGNRRQLEFDLVVSPGADPHSIVLNFGEGERLTALRDGSLKVGEAASALVLHHPSIYQLEGGKKVSIQGDFAIQSKDRVAIKLANYDKSQALVIDPTLAYSTYLTASGGSDSDAIAVDANGDAFITGTTYSSSFPIVNGYQTSAAAAANGIVFVSELNPSGTALLYSTYLGGSSGDYAESIAVDGAGGAYVSGYTFSTDFPTLNAFQTSNNDASTSNGFVARIDTTQTGTASLIYSTYLGGGGNSTNPYGGDLVGGIATDGSGLAYVTGETVSDTSVAPFPTTATAYQTTLNGDNGNAFVTVLDTNQSGSASLIYSTYLGGDAPGSLGDFGFGIAVDQSGNAYIIGQTTSDSSGPFPTTASAYQSSLNSSNGNVFLGEIATTQSGAQSLVYSTYFGGSSTSPLGDDGGSVALDSSGKVYIVGDATSSDFPVTSGVLQTTNSTNGDAFVAKWDLTQSGASSLLYSTLLGGTNGASGDLSVSVAVDPSGDAYLTGSASSSDFPTTAGAYQTSIPNSTWAAFVSELNPSATSLLYSSYLGGSCADNGTGVTLDSLGNPYLSGYTCSSDFPTYPSGVFQTTFESPQSGFVTKFALNANPGIVASESPQPNANGWNNSAVTVSFTCIPGGAPLSSCTSPDTVSTEGASQTVTGTAEDTASNTASTTVTVNFDLTAPSLSVTTPSTSSVTVSTPSIAIAGTVSDSLSGVSGVTCGGATASVTGSSFSCTVPLFSASNTVAVVGTDVAGNTATSNLTVTVSMSTPTSLTVTPPTPNMTIGGTQAFQAIDQTGTLRPDATWSINDATVASFETSNPNTLVGNAAGTATVTATVGSVTGTTTVTVLSSGLSVGTQLWSAPTISGYTTQQIVQAVPSVNGPDLYAVDADTSGDVLVRAFKSDGEQLWNSTSLGLSSVNKIAGDNSGGLIALGGASSGYAVSDLNPVTGASNWQYDAPASSAVPSYLAVGTNGNVYIFENNCASSRNCLDIIDGSSGSLTTQVQLPQSSSSSINRDCESNENETDYSPANYGPASVGPTGTIYFEVQTSQETQTWVCSEGIEQSVNYSRSNDLSLYAVSPSGGVSSTTIDSNSGTTSSAIPSDIVGDVIPDGLGGALAAFTKIPSTGWNGSQAFSVADIGQGTEADFSDEQGPEFPSDASLVLGDNGIAFIVDRDGADIDSFNVPALSENWNYYSPLGGTLSFVSSTPSGSVAVNDSMQGLTQIDSTGTASSPVAALQSTQPIFSPLPLLASYNGGTAFGSWVGISSGAAVVQAGLFTNPGSAAFATPSADGQNSRQQVATATVTPNYANKGQKNKYDGLHFLVKGQNRPTCSETLGLLTQCAEQIGVWPINVEVQVHVTDDPLNWVVDQTVIGFIRGQQYNNSTFAITPYSNPEVPTRPPGPLGGNDTPLNTPLVNLVQFDPLHDYIFWLDSPGLNQNRPSNNQVYSATFVLNFASVACLSTNKSRCASALWHIKIVVNAPATLDTTQSAGGAGWLSLNF